MRAALQNADWVKPNEKIIHNEDEEYNIFIECLRKNSY
jgi:hypothetical protein